MDENQKESIRLLTEWNKWLVAVEMTGIAALGFLVNGKQATIVDVIGVLTIIIFLFSIVISSFFLLNLSYVISESVVKKGQRLTEVRVPFRTYFQQKKWPLFGREHYRIGQFTILISRLFVLGLISFSMTFALRLGINV